MSAESSSGPGDHKVEVFGKPPSPKNMTHYIRPTLWGIVVVYAVVFLLVNRASTRINFIFFEAEVPLIVALFVAIVLGFLVGAGLVMRRNHKAAKPAKSKSKK